MSGNLHAPPSENEIPIPNFFSAGSPFLHHPLLTPDRATAEVNFVLAQTDLTLDQVILDIGCGVGRHTIELAQRGYQVVGIDPSEAMIQAATERAAEVGVQPKFIQSSGEDFSYHEKFSAAICLFTTFGQINDTASKSPPKNDHPLIEQVAENLIPGGFFILEIPQKGWVINNVKESESFIDNEKHTTIHREFDVRNSLINETFTIITRDETLQYYLRFHLYDPKEVHVLLINSGFQVLGTYGDFHNTPISVESPNMVVVAQLNEFSEDGEILDGSVSPERQYPQNSEPALHLPKERIRIIPCPPEEQ